MINRAYTFSLDVNNALQAPPINVKQGDTASVLFATLLDNFEPINLTGYSVKLAVQRPDGTLTYQNTNAVDNATGLVTFVFLASTLSVAGTASAELSIYGADNQAITMFPFSFEIEPVINLSGAVIGGGELPLLTPVFSEITVLQTHDTEHENRIHILEEATVGNVDILYDEVASLKTDNTANKSNITVLQGKASTLETAVSSLNTSRTADESELASLSGTVANQITKIADLEDNKHSHSNKSTLDRIPDDTNAINGQVITKRADGSVVWQSPDTSVATDVTALKGRASALETDSTANQADIVILQGQVETDGTSITTLQKATTANSTAVTTLESTIATVVTSIPAITTNIAELQTHEHTHSNKNELDKVPTSAGTVHGKVLMANGDSTLIWGTVDAVPQASLDTLTARVIAVEGVTLTEATAITAIQTVNTAQDGRLTAIETVNTAQTTSMATASTNITTLQTDNTSNKIRLTVLESAKVVDEGNITTAQADITSLKSSRTTDENRVTVLETAKTADEARLTVVEGINTTQTTDITSLKASRTMDESNITALQTSDTSQNGRLTAIETLNTAQGTDITSLKASRTADEADITSLKSSRTADESNITTLQTTVTSLGASISGVKIHQSITTASADGQVTVAHGLTYNPVTDTLFAYYKGGELYETTDWISSVSNTSITLTNYFSLLLGDRISFIINTNSK